MLRIPKPRAAINTSRAARSVRRVAGLAIDKIGWMIDSLFDLRYGTDTTGIIQLRDLTIHSPHLKNGTFYEATPTKLVHLALRALQIEYGKYLFLDFGSGKGRTLLLASHYPFAEVVGLEFAEALHRVAENNIAIYRDPRQRCKKIRSVCIDATEYSIPCTNIVAYFFNPFDESIFAQVLANMPNFDEKGYTLFLIYCQTHCSLLLDRAPLLPHKMNLDIPFIWTRRPGWISTMSIYSNRPF
jgi:hypothetical protein